MRAIRCVRGSFPARVDLIEITSSTPRGASVANATALTAERMFRAGSAVLAEPVEKDNRGDVTSHSRCQLDPWYEVGPPSTAVHRQWPFSSSMGGPDAS